MTRVFGQRIADGLRETALDLSFDLLRIDRAADVVHANDLQNLHEPGARVDFDFHRLRHVAIAVVGNAHTGLRIERRRARRKVLHRRFRIGAGKFRARGERRIVYGASAHQRQTRRRRAPGVGCFRRIVGDHRDRLRRDAERRRCDLAHRAVCALPALGCADAHHRAFDLARAVEFHGRRRLFGEPERIADVLDPRRNTDAATQMCASRLRFAEHLSVTDVEAAIA